MTDGRNMSDQPVYKKERTYDNIKKIANGQEDDYTTSCLLDYHYFKDHKIIKIDLSKQQEFDTDPKAIQQIVSQEM